MLCGSSGYGCEHAAVLVPREPSVMTFREPMRTSPSGSTASPVASPTAIARSRRSGYTPNETRRLSKPASRRRAQASAFHAMSRSTMPVTPRAAARSRASRTKRSETAGSTSLSRREISNAGPSRRMPCAVGAIDSRRNAALFSQTLWTSALMRYVGTSPVCSSSRRSEGVSGHSASRKPVPTRRPSSRTGECPMTDAACTASVTSPSGVRCATRAHCTVWTWWSHSPGTSHPPSPSTTTPRRGSAPAGAMSVMTPPRRCTSTGASPNGSTRPAPVNRTPAMTSTCSPRDAVTSVPPGSRRGRVASPRPDADRHTGCHRRRGGR